MTKVETLIYEYNCCLDCRHCGFNQWSYTERGYVWGCDEMDRKLGHNQLDFKIPKWCPLSDKEVT